MQIWRLAIPSPLRKQFDYLAPAKHLATAIPGLRVKVNFAGREVIALLLSIHNETDVPASKIKPVLTVLDQTPLLPKSLFKLVLWAADYYQYSVGEALHSALPALLRQGESPQLQQENCWKLTHQGQKIKYWELQKAPKQAALMEYLENNSVITPSGLKTLAIARGTIKSLEQKGWVESFQQQTTPSIIPTSDLPLQLNHEQQYAVNSIQESLHKFNCFLLEGVTGSGKTEVYLQCIQTVLEQGKQALVLVPEIGLTPQTIHRFRTRLATRIVCLHSGLSDKERMNAWLLAKQGLVGVVIGTRSAIFTPLAFPGLIIVDEEHDGSFKQQEGFRYSARDLAIMRAQGEHFPVILGSATPSLESIHNVRQSKYMHIQLQQRAGNARPPHFDLVDIRTQVLQDGLAHSIIAKMQQHLTAGNQVLVFLNRRGFAPTLMCHDCGWIALCQRCDARMTLHYRPAQLHCHHCDTQQFVPHHCPVCDSKNLQALGYGTERSEQALEGLFPKFPILRIDRDSTRRKNAMEDMLKQIHQAQPIILIGTQMLAKGHHFPNVTLVTVLNIDSGLFSADFRGEERMGQLLIQVAGRAGRAEKVGEVCIQTLHPEHPTLQTLIHDGYHLFAQCLLQQRQQTGLPPYRFMAIIRAESPTLQAPKDFLIDARRIYEQNHHRAVFCSGPTPAPMEKKAGRYRAQLLIHAEKRTVLQQSLKQLIQQLEVLRSARKVRWFVDIDPLDIF